MMFISIDSQQARRDRWPQPVGRARTAAGSSMAAKGAAERAERSETSIPQERRALPTMVRSGGNRRKLAETLFRGPIAVGKYSRRDCESPANPVAEIAENAEIDVSRRKGWSPPTPTALLDRPINRSVRTFT